MFFSLVILRMQCHLLQQLHVDILSHPMKMLEFVLLVASNIQLIVSEDVQSVVSDNKVETCQNLGNMLGFDCIHCGYENVPEHMVSLINVQIQPVLRPQP
jgi:hypothetical protein